MLTALIAALMTYAWQGICGSRADWLTVKGLHLLKEKLFKAYEAPVNHDVVDGLIVSFTGALHDACRQLAGIAAAADEIEFINKLTGILQHQIKINPIQAQRLLDLLAKSLTPILAMGETGKVRRGDLSKNVAKAALAWIESEIGRAAPPSLEAVFLHGGRRDGAALQSWTQFYRVRIAELIKTNDRFQRIVDSNHLAAIAEEQKEQGHKLAAISEWVKPSTWSAYVELNAVEKPEFIARNSSGNIAFAYVDDPSNVYIAPGEGFSLRFDSTVNEEAVLLEGYQGQWQVTPINGNSPSKWILCNPSRTDIPPDFPLKTEEPGVHQFVILAVAKSLKAEITDIVNVSDELFPVAMQNKLVERLAAAPPDEVRILAGQIIVRSSKE